MASLLEGEDMKMSNKLKPCPFCGSDVDFFIHLADDSGYTELIIDCKECSATMYILVYSDKEIDIEKAKEEMFTAWNTRVEPTAKVENYEDPAGLGGYGDCSECGAYVHVDYAYCPNCGVKLDWV